MQDAHYNFYVSKHVFVLLQENEFSGFVTSVTLFFVGSGRRRALFSAFYCKNGKKDQLLILSFQYISAVIILEIEFY